MIDKDVLLSLYKSLVRPRMELICKHYLERHIQEAGCHYSRECST